MLQDSSLRPAKITALFCTLTAVVYGALQIEPSALIVLFFSFGPLFTIILWLQQDARKNGIGTIVDFGLFVWIAWPILIPWYVFKTRGRPGWRLLLGLFALIISADLGWIIGAWGIYIIRYVLAWVIYGIRYAFLRGIYIIRYVLWYLHK